MADADEFDRLLEAMPRIAEAVNSFSSETVQSSAFDALIRTIAGTKSRIVSPARDADSSLEQLNENHARPEGSAQPAKAGRARKGTKVSVAPVRDIDFWPTDKQSLPDFVADKGAANNNERNLLAVYYVEQMLEIPNIGAGHVLAAYKANKWPEPNNPSNSLQVTASAKAWIDTGDMQAIKTMPAGRNVVEHQMPLGKAKTKA